MTDRVPALQGPLQFVSGDMPPEDFRRLLVSDQTLADVLNDSGEFPGYCESRAKDTHSYLLELDFDDPGDLVSAMGALTAFFERRGIDYIETSTYSDLFDLLLDAQPDWMDVDMKFLKDSVLTDAPDMNKTALKKWLRARLRELFRYTSRPPRWLQAADWPIRNGRPLLFIGQATVKNYYSEDAAVYLFHDADSGDPEDLVTVLQFM